VADDARGAASKTKTMEETMTDNSNKPAYRVIRYYEAGKKHPNAEVGAVWLREDGSLSIQLTTLDQCIQLYAFPIKQSA
jgi:hypothetical protein